ncbi:hypothetical protein NDU88_009044 [Pleurodeles waltl]|uniref:Uncharacterized protein n=1 Tax=Pleurodeles waltl TaxID=8319 RepID=A0AAV7RZD6_PLEWA|nr:hypothetical protein NDU88_009044 [Pleurodeles waltl]
MKTEEPEQCWYMCDAVPLNDPPDENDPRRARPSPETLSDSGRHCGWLTYQPRRRLLIIMLLLSRDFRLQIKYLRHYLNKARAKMAKMCLLQ